MATVARVVGSHGSWWPKPVRGARASPV